LLNQGQLEQLKVYVKEEIPSSAKQEINFAKNHFGASYTPSAMVPLLHRLNFTYKKPKLIPGKENEAAKELFSQELQKLEKELAQTDQLDSVTQSLISFMAMSCLKDISLVSC
jgi:transposase